MSQPKNRVARRKHCKKQAPESDSDSSSTYSLNSNKNSNDFFKDYSLSFSSTAYNQSHYESNSRHHNINEPPVRNPYRKEPAQTLIPSQIKRIIKKDSLPKQHILKTASSTSNFSQSDSYSSISYDSEPLVIRNYITRKRCEIGQSRTCLHRNIPPSSTESSLSILQFKPRYGSPKIIESSNNSSTIVKGPSLRFPNSPELSHSSHTKEKGSSQTNTSL